MAQVSQVNPDAPADQGSSDMVVEAQPIQMTEEIPSEEMAEEIEEEEDEAQEAKQDSSTEMQISEAEATQTAESWILNTN